MAGFERASRAMVSTVHALDYDPRRQVLTVVIDPLHDPDMSGTTRFCDEDYPGAKAIHVIAGDISKIVYFRGAEGWASVNTRVPR